MNSKQSVSLYGIGYAYPLQASNGAGPVLTRDEDLIKRSMRCVILTRIGELPHLVKNGVPFGTFLEDGLFEGEDAAKDMIPYEVKRALSLWEPRVVLVGDAQVSSQDLPEGGVRIITNIPFRYRSTGRADNLVQPFGLRRN